MRTVHGLVLLAVLVATTPAPSQAMPALYPPWPCDVSYRVTNGHDTRTHTGMDHWAWDFGIPVGGEVAAPAAGTVRRIRMDSSRGGCDSGYANDANYVIVEFGDGTEALIMHLQRNSSALRAGERVEQGQVVGRVGLTGWVCGAHLHFQVQETCSSWWCQSVHASFVDHGDPAEGTTVRSTNCPVVEPCTAVLDGDETIIDDLTSCFERETSWWWDVATGYDGHHYYTWANAGAAPDTVGRWVFTVLVPGSYRVEAHVPGTADSSRQAVYLARGGFGATASAPVDQSATAGWITVGTFEMAAGEGRSLSLADNTGEARDLDRKLAFDAVRCTFEPDEPPDGGADADADADLDIEDDPDRDADVETEPWPDADLDADPDREDLDADADADSPGDGSGSFSGGCSCRSDGPFTSPGIAGIAALLIVSLVARGARRRAHCTGKRSRR